MRSRISFSRHAGDEALGRDKREAAGQLLFDLAADALPPFGKSRQNREAAVEMPDRF